MAWQKTNDEHTRSKVKLRRQRALVLTNVCHGDVCSCVFMCTTFQWDCSHGRPVLNRCQTTTVALDTFWAEKDSQGTRANGLGRRFRCGAWVCVRSVLLLWKRNQLEMWVCCQTPNEARKKSYASVLWQKVQRCKLTATVNTIRKINRNNANTEIVYITAVYNLPAVPWEEQCEKKNSTHSTVSNRCLLLMRWR